MKRIINFLNLMLLLLIILAACHLSEKIESNYLVTGTPTPLLFPTVTPTNTSLPVEITAIPQLTPIWPKDGSSANWQSAILFKDGNDERGIFYVDSRLVHYLDVDLLLHSWSPSGKYLLFSRGDMLYIAEADGSTPQPAYDAGEIEDLNWPPGLTASDFEGFWPAQWLTDDLILLSVITVEYAPLNPYLYLLDVQTGSLQAIDLDNWHVVEAVSPNGTFWIQSSATGIELASPDGQSMPVSPDLIAPFVSFPAGPPYFAILPNDKGFLFLSCGRTNEACQIKLATVTNLGVSSVDPIFTLEEFGNVSNLRVSANGEYLAFVQNVSENSHLYIINLTTGHLILQRPWNEIYGPPEIMWSPDSQILAYVSIDTKGGKLMGLDVKTGEVAVITDVMAFPELLDWQYIKINH